MKQTHQMAIKFYGIYDATSISMWMDERASFKGGKQCAIKLSNILICEIFADYD
jgi:hypothetical protein